MALQGGGHGARQELPDLLPGPAREAAGIQQGGQLGLGHGPGGILGQQFQQLVGAALGLDAPTGLQGRHAEALMQILAVPAPLHGLHEQHFGGHERQFLGQARLDHPGVDHQARGHVPVEHQNGIHRQEPLADGQPPVGAVVQGALQPLVGAGLVGAGHEPQHEAGEAVDAL